MEKILVVRFSALGDVAMTVPVVASLASQYPDLEITVMSKPHFKPMFEKLPQNVSFWGVNLRDYKGITGLERLFKEVDQKDFSCVADLHDVLRTKYLRFRLHMSHANVIHIDKGRSDKRKLVSKGASSISSPLKSSFERYSDVFKALGYPVELKFSSIFGSYGGDLSLLKTSFNSKPATRIWIGVAPFAAHEGKIYPTELMESVIGELNSLGHVFLFGGGEKEMEQFRKWEEKFLNVTSVATICDGMDKELILMSHLNVMLSMDSGNMHLASLVGTPVVSIWGATHPSAGFLGWGQNLKNVLQVEMACRPCSIYGNKPCTNGGDYPCLKLITPQQIVEKIKTLLK